MQQVDGRAIATRIRAETQRTIARLGLTPGLAIVLVGDDPASHLYVSLKERASAEVGIRFLPRRLPAAATEDEIINTIRQLNSDASVHGTVVQLPLPAGVDENRIIRAIDPVKDADGFHPDNLTAFMVGRSRVTPALVAAVRHCVAATGAAIKGQRVIILANAPVFAEPLMYSFIADGAQAEYLDPKNATAQQTKVADILIVALGQPHRITATYIKPGAVLVDIGTTRVGNRILGDIDPDSVADTAAWLTPVPGGVGPVTVATLLQNVATLAR